MSLEITISPSIGEKKFEPKRLHISRETAGAAAADLVGARLILKSVGNSPRNQKEIEEIKELVRALTDSCRGV